MPLTQKEVSAEAHNILHELQNEYPSLMGWRVSWHNKKRSLGTCYFHLRTIKLSTFFLPSITMDRWRDVIRHEIAHALAGPYVQSHGHEWKQWARRVGATPKSCQHMQGEEREAHKKRRLEGARYIWECPSCHNQNALFRRRKRHNPKLYSCGLCGHKGLVEVKSP